MKVDEAGKNMCALALCIYTYTHTRFFVHPLLNPLPLGKSCGGGGSGGERRARGCFTGSEGCMAEHAYLARTRTHTHMSLARAQLPCRGREGDKLGRNSADAICINEAAAPTMVRASERAPDELCTCDRTGNRNSVCACRAHAGS